MQAQEASYWEPVRMVEDERAREDRIIEAEAMQALAYRLCSEQLRVKPEPIRARRVA